MIGRVETEVERGGTIEFETRYYLCSIVLAAERFGQAVRGHWGIENRLHWVPDVVFDEDLARLRSAHAPANTAITRHAALNLRSRAKPFTSCKNPRKRAGVEHGLPRSRHSRAGMTFKQFAWAVAQANRTRNFPV